MAIQLSAYRRFPFAFAIVSASALAFTGLIASTAPAHAQDASDYRSARTGPAPRMLRAGSEVEELDTAAEIVRSWLDAEVVPETIGLLVRTEQSGDRLVRALEERDVRFVRLWFTDVLGFLKSVAIAPAELEGARRLRSLLADLDPAAAAALLRERIEASSSNSDLLGSL